MPSPPEIRWGAPPWRIEATLPNAPRPDRVDVAVVGAGFTGLATAIACAMRGASVHVFEQGALGAGASGRTGGLALEGTAAGPLPGADACLDALRALVRAHAIDCDLELGGCWVVRHVTGTTRPTVASWPDGGDGWLVVDHGDSGGALDPGKLVAGLARAAQRAGAVLHERAPVEAVEPMRLRVGSRWIAAERIALATNAFLPRFLPDAGIRPALTFALATPPLPRAALDAIALGATPFYTGDIPYLWGRATRDGRLVIGAGLAFDDGGDLARVAIDREDVRALAARLASRVRGLHPALAGVEPTHFWGGPIAFREHGVPILAELAPGVLATGACAGHGVALSASIADLVARWALEGAPLPEWGRVQPASPSGARVALTTREVSDRTRKSSG
jgi:glycine/D-amino acid oxidase-like deaminating enzyme